MNLIKQAALKKNLISSFDKDDSQIEFCVSFFYILSFFYEVGLAQALFPIETFDYLPSGIVFGYVLPQVDHKPD